MIEEIGILLAGVGTLATGIANLVKALQPRKGNKKRKKK